MNKIELAKKIKFVDDISETFKEFSDKFSVDKIEYKVFECVWKDDVYSQEFLVVTFKGGAISARNCNGNSFSAIFEEIGRLIKGGYYSEVDDYKHYLEKYKELDLTEQFAIKFN